MSQRAGRDAVSLNLKSVRDLVSLAKAKPGQLNYGSQAWAAART